jgi:hypothetical protein
MQDASAKGPAGGPCLSAAAAAAAESETERAMVLQRERGTYLDGVVLEEGVIQGGLVGDMHAVYDVSVWTLSSSFYS